MLEVITDGIIYDTFKTFKKYSPNIAVGTAAFNKLLEKLIKAKPEFFASNKEMLFKVCLKYVLNFKETNEKDITVQEFIRRLMLHFESGNVISRKTLSIILDIDNDLLNAIINQNKFPRSEESYIIELKEENEMYKYFNLLKEFELITPHTYTQTFYSDGKNTPPVLYKKKDCVDEIYNIWNIE